MRGALERYARGAPLRAHADRRGTPAEPRKTRTVPNEYLEPSRLPSLSTRSMHYGPGVYRIGDGEATTPGRSVAGALRAGGGRDTGDAPVPDPDSSPGRERVDLKGGLRLPAEARTGPVRAGPGTSPEPPAPRLAAAHARPYPLLRLAGRTAVRRAGGHTEGGN